MTNWVLRGLRTGVRTTAYPSEPERRAGVSPGRPKCTEFGTADTAAAMANLCPTAAISRAGHAAEIDYSRCIHCYRCHRTEQESALSWEDGYEWAARSDSETAVSKLHEAFGRSLYIRFVDAGACSACVSEARQLNNPYYNMHRLGFLMTPTPRNADVLMVSGPVSDAMELPLRKTYDAMPEPKRVVAIGVCAISGGVFGRSFAALGGAASVIPVDVVVPGCPPPPLAILHGLLLTVERKPPSTLRSRAVQETPA